MSDEFSMLALFRKEAATHCQTLQSKLKDEMDDATLDQVTQAVHGLKSGAQINGLEPVASMAAAMESAIGGANDLILEATSLIATIADVDDEGVPKWLDEHKEELKRLADTLSETKSEEKPKEKPKASGKPMELSIDASMLDLFRIEVETHVATLNEGLLAVERGESSEEMLESLMRAAHSIKGAARVIGLDPAVNLAHAMEDCFVAAQEGKLVVDEDKVDVLLKGIDLLGQLSTIADDEMEPWLHENAVLIDQLVAAFGAILRGETPNLPEKPVKKTPAPTEPIKTEKIAAQVLTPQAPKEEKPVKKEVEDRVLRVTAESINRLMGLAGESLVESRWLAPFGDSLLQLKKQLNELNGVIDYFRDAVGGHTQESAEHYLMQLQHKTNECREDLADRISDLEGFIRQHASLSDRLYHEVINSRMRPFADGITAFPRTVRDLARELGKSAKLEIVGKSTPVDRDILEKLEAPLNHLIRNAVDHGLEMPDDRMAAGKPRQGRIKLEARHRAGMLSITVSDDGKGVDVDRLRKKVIERNFVSEEMAKNLTEAELLEFLFLPGFSTASKVTQVSGRGVGMDVVQAMIQEVGGTLRCDTKLGKGFKVNMQLPLTLSVIRALVAEISSEPYAFPLARVDRVLTIAYDDIELVEDRQYFSFEGENIGLVPAHQVLELKPTTRQNGEFPVIVISDRANAYGIAVDRVCGERELVVQDIDHHVGKIPDISSGAFLEDGEPILIVDVEDVVKSIDSILHGGRRLTKIGLQEETEEASRTKRVLVVDDSITVREVECRLLRNRGYEVDTAVDGMDGWNAARLASYDLIVTDVDMPRMNGIEFVKALKADPDLKDIPVVIVSYKDREEDRLAGLDAGADFYLTKSSLHDETLITVVGDLIGGPTT